MKPEQLPILYRDDFLVAVHKPSGLLVHRTSLDRHETRFALQMVRDQIGQAVYPVHRLDKPTSGILLFALDPASARQMGQWFSEQKVQKTYLAVVRGIPPQSGIIDTPLRREDERCTCEELALQSAVTRFRTLATAELPVAVGRYATSRYSLVEATPETGRHHQIRRHLKHRLHPIIGDTKYGEGRHNRFFREQFACQRLLLAAVALRVPHPESGDTVTISARPEASFTQVLEALGWGEEITF